MFCTLRKYFLERSVDIILKASIPKLREKLLEALQAVLPIVAIVLVLCFSIAPVSPSILLCFLLGAAMIITGLLEKWMEKVPPVVGLAGSMFLFYFTRYAADGYLQLGHWLITLPGFLYANYFTAYLGFYPFGFFSTDYFPLTPWLFLFWAGFYLHHLAERTAQSLRPLRRSVCPPLGWLGRNSLMLYLLHQPVIYGVLTVVFLLLRRGGGAL